jgi:hypothetical protein
VALFRGELICAARTGDPVLIRCPIDADIPLLHSPSVGRSPDGTAAPPGSNRAIPTFLRAGCPPHPGIDPHARKLGGSQICAAVSCADAVACPRSGWDADCPPARASCRRGVSAWERVAHAAGRGAGIVLVAPSGRRRQSSPTRVRPPGGTDMLRVKSGEFHTRALDKVKVRRNLINDHEGEPGAGGAGQQG